MENATPDTLQLAQLLPKVVGDLILMITSLPFVYYTQHNTYNETLKRDICHVMVSHFPPIQVSKHDSMLIRGGKRGYNIKFLKHSYRALITWVYIGFVNGGFKILWYEYVWVRTSP